MQATIDDQQNLDHLIIKRSFCSFYSDSLLHVMDSVLHVETSMFRTDSSKMKSAN